MDVNLHAGSSLVSSAPAPDGVPAARHRRGTRHAGARAGRLRARAAAALGICTAVVAMGLVLAPSAVQSAVRPSDTMRLPAANAAQMYTVELVMSGQPNGGGSCPGLSKDTICAKTPVQTLTSFTLSLVAGGGAGKQTGGAASSSSMPQQADATMDVDSISLALLPAVQGNAAKWLVEFFDPTTGRKLFEFEMVDVSVMTWVLTDNPSGASIQITWGWRQLEQTTYSAGGAATDDASA
jgi:hypothetical protein